MQKMYKEAMSKPNGDKPKSKEKPKEASDEKKPKRKFCNTSAYGLKGDYAYEACGAFCKQATAANHCKFCKCRSWR